MSAGEVMVTIGRHALALDGPLQELLDRLSGIADKRLEQIEVSDFDRFDLLAIHLSVAKARCVIDAQAADFWTWEAWVKVMQIGSALFSAGVASPDEVVHFRVGRESKALPALGARDYLTADNWLDSFYLAAICRENKRLQQLAHIPVSFLREQSAGVEEYLFSWVEALQNAIRGDGEKMWDSMLAAARQSAPEGLEEAERMKALQLFYPLIDVFRHLMGRDVAEFNTALGKSLDRHKAYWSENDPASVDGLVALAPLALACIAHDSDMDLDVESDYLPENLLIPEWVGEMET
ncbi:immunity 49 family protein [Streptomyces sp. NPDC002221]|uniref:immunity 49 family protein n=1 Tax=Streptomyces sp. NPDC002221 TaxID=3364639 RepID=UPI00369960DC